MLREKIMIYNINYSTSEVTKIIQIERYAVILHLKNCEQYLLYTL